MSDTVYSFQDLNCSFTHPSVGQISMNGEGIGSITITRANDVTSHDVSADGSVMISKIKSKNGTVAISVQQSSPLNKWLDRLYNYLEVASSSEWAKASIILRHLTLGEGTVCTGVTFQKRADKPYQAQGQQVTWNLMAANIDDN
ncbi:phage protein [uncultured Tissierella sp.]|uniref:phage protein n=1 Tax=uncultured Tissierella sp. TaxID=448160 RepID=UPI002803C6C3|nr:phage protein [uncultured Tissierella sp.]MDU5080230.1 phage protein [Bacillota bacterium]